METLGYLYLCHFYEQEDDARRLLVSPQLTSVVSVLLASSVASAALLTNHGSVDASHLSYRWCDRIPVVYTPPRSSHLQVGSRGARVTEVQIQLRNWGFPLNPANRLGVDGIFGAQTDLAVREFQTYAGLSVDGIVGPRTMNALFTPRNY